MLKLVLVRHGESVWNRKNVFTGWTDVGLSKGGIEEAREAGRVLKKEGYSFDLAYVSVLKRSTETLETILEEMGAKNLPAKKSWKLNERHYGALQGLNKSETAKKFGEEKVHLWRRSYDVRPPALKKTDPRYPGKDPLYRGVPEKDLPVVECLKDVIRRVTPYWLGEIVPELRKGKKILIVGHGNSFRALVKYLDKVPDDEIASCNIPTGIPLVYELDKGLNPVRHYYLANHDKVKEKIEKIKKQGKAI